MAEQVENRLDEVKRLLLDLCVPRRYRGFEQMAYAVFLAAVDEDLLDSYTRLYRLVAERYGVTWRCVERNLRGAVAACWRNGGKPLFEKLAWASCGRRPRVGEFIDIVAIHLMRQWMGSSTVSAPKKTGQEEAEDGAEG